MQAFHEPPSRRPHCSSTQQWVTPELGLSSTPGQGIQTQAEVKGNSVTHNHQEECSPRNLPCSLPTDPHSPHACSTLGECTFSVTWTVLWLPVSLTLGYRNRPDRKSSGSVAATGFLPRALSFLCALSHLEGVAHRPTSLTQSSIAWSQQPTGKTDTGFPKPVQQSQDDLTVLISEQGLHAQASSASPNNKDPSTQIKHRLPIQGMRTRVFSETDTDSIALDRGVHGFFRTNTSFLFCIRITRGSLTDWLPLIPPQDSRIEMDENTPHNLLHLFYLHAPGLTLVTLGTSCVPSVRLPHTTWEITCPSKRT